MNITFLQSSPHGLKYIILISESISEMRHGTLIQVDLQGTDWWLSQALQRLDKNFKLKKMKGARSGDYGGLALSFSDFKAKMYVMALT